MLNAVRIGPVGVSFPDELWRCVFEQASTLKDALSWADAFQRPVAPGDYRALLQLAAPQLLQVVPKPTAQALLGQAPEGMLDYSPLVGPLYDDSPSAIAKAEDFALMFDATRAMTAFAPRTAITYDLLQLSHDAWSVCLPSDVEDESAYRSRCSSTVLFDAFRDEAKTATLWLGYRTKLPPFYAGLPALKTLQLLDIDRPLDLRPIKALEGLTDITLGADTCFAVSMWFRKAMARLAPGVRVTQLTQATPTPPMPLRFGSQAWLDARQMRVFATPPEAATSPLWTDVIVCEAPDALDRRRVALAGLQQLIGDIDSIYAAHANDDDSATTQES